MTTVAQIKSEVNVKELVAKIHQMHLDLGLEPMEVNEEEVLTEAVEKIILDSLTHRYVSDSVGHQGRFGMYMTYTLTDEETIEALTSIEDSTVKFHVNKLMDGTATEKNIRMIARLLIEKFENTTIPTV